MALRTFPSGRRRWRRESGISRGRVGTCRDGRLPGAVRPPNMHSRSTSTGTWPRESIGSMPQPARLKALRRPIGRTWCSTSSTGSRRSFGRTPPEDAWLYPEIARRAGSPWATKLMTFEHDQIFEIGRKLEIDAELLEIGPTTTPWLRARGHLFALEAVLRAHIEREERFLDPGDRGQPRVRRGSTTVGREDGAARCCARPGNELLGAAQAPVSRRRADATTRHHRVPARGGHDRADRRNRQARSVTHLLACPWRSMSIQVLPL